MSLELVISRWVAGGGYLRCSRCGGAPANSDLSDYPSNPACGTRGAKLVTMVSDLNGQHIAHQALEIPRASSEDFSTLLRQEELDVGGKD